MAKMQIKGIDEYAMKLSKLGDKSDEIAKKSVYAGAKVVADEIKKRLENVLSDEATGELLESFGVTPISQDKQGNWNCKVGFDGYDKNGVPNQLKARVLESGSSRTQKKHPFVRPAVRAKKNEALRSMEAVIDTEISKLNL